MENNLIELTKENDIEGVRKFIADGGDINMQNRYGWTALFYVSSWCASLKIAKLLIDDGADLNIQDKNGWTALMFASLFNYPEIVKALIKAGAKLDIQDKNGKTALMHASHCNCPEIVKLLKEGGAKLDLQDKNGWTALMYASHCNCPEIVKLLKEAGARLDIQDKYGKTAYMRAEENGYSVGLCEVSTLAEIEKEIEEEKMARLLTAKKVDLLPVKCDEEIASYRYVKLPNYILKRSWFVKPNSLMLYNYLLLKKSYLDRTLTSVNKLTEALKLTTKEIRTALKHLQETNDIEIKTTTKYSIITLLFEESFDEKSKYKEKENLPIADIINKIAKLLDNDDIEIEIVGSWLWISGDSKQYKNEIKEAGFKFSNAKKMWFYSCKTEYKAIKSNIDIDKIRLKYGSEILKNKSQLKKWFLNVK
jgi:hypothetical protein